ncbi:MAG: DNA/RNA non-specific endonuclease [Saprospiraceae bacterium]
MNDDFYGYGYDHSFFDLHNIVSLPRFSDSLAKSVAKTKEGHQIIRYRKYSVVQHAERGFPILTATNIDGNSFISIPRKEVFENGRDNWKKDSRLDDKYQLGNEFYKAEFSDFDRGHLTKREDVQWGNSIEKARVGAQSTFYYTNSVPQRREINRSIWLKIENYILHNQASHHNMKVNVFSGPVLKDDDPIFVTEVKGENILIPTLFWKVVYYLTADNLLARTAFLVGQKHLLEKHEIVLKSRSHSKEDELFMGFSEAETFQVSVDLIEKLTGLYFSEALEIYQDQRPSHLVLEEVNVRGIDGETVQPFIDGLKLM